MRDKFIKILKNMISILLIMIFGIVFVDKFISNDTFFDLKTGESILKYGIDFKDHFSFIPNLIYIYHHWFYDLIIYYIYKIFSFDGIFLLNLFVFTIFGVIVFFINNKRNNKFLSIVVTLVTMVFSSFAFQMRVQSITYILFFLEVYFLEKLYITGNKKYSIFLLLLSIFIVNLHMPIWIFCLILFLPYLVEMIFCLLSIKFKVLKDIFNIEEPKNMKLIFITFLILLFSGLLSPLKLYPYTFFTKSLFNNSYLFIKEMSKTVLYYWGKELFLIIFIIIGIYLNFIKFKLRDFFIFIGLFIFSLIAARNIAFFLIIMPTIMMKNINIDFKLKNNKIIKYIKKINFKVVGGFLIIGLIGLYTYLCCCFYHMSDDYGISKIFPDEIVNYIRENINYKEARIYNDFNYGSYLEFHDIPVFIDSRAEVYMKEFNGGYDIISDYKKSFNFNEYKEIFDKYKFDYAVVYINSSLYYYLKGDGDYRLLLEENGDCSYALFEKII